jgi:hypothetical protein
MTRDDDPESRPRKESGMREHVLAGLNVVGCSFHTCLDSITKNFHLDRARPDRHEDEIETRRVHAKRSSESGDSLRVASNRLTMPIP